MSGPGTAAGTTAPGAVPGGGAGARLREAREARGLGVAEVAERLRVRPALIVALEAGSDRELPPGPYARGLAEAYAALLGLGPDEVALLRGRFAAEEGGGRPVFRYPRRERLNWRDWTLPMGFAAALACWFVARLLFAPAPEPLPSPPPPPVLPVIEAPPAPAEVDAAGGAALAPGAGEQPPAVRVLMRSEGATWVEAAVDGGEARRYELGPGRTLELTARERIAATLGDAGLVRIRSGDRELGFIGQKGETRRGLLFLPRAKAAAPAPETGGAGD